MKSRSAKYILGAFALAAALPLAAQQQNSTTSASPDTIFSNMAFNLMLAIIVLLLFVIIAMAEVVKAGAAHRRAQARKEKEKSNTGTIAGLTLLFLLGAGSLYAQAKDAVPAAEAAVSQAPPFDYWHMGAFTFFLMLTVIAFEILIAVMLYRSGMMLIRTEAVTQALKKRREEPSLLEKLNASVAIEEESAILMDHDYDGIRELDNNLPPWWKYGFYLTIGVAVVYLFNFHVLHTGKLSLEEYQQEMKDGAAAVAEYQKGAVDLVDEKTVTRLTDAASLSAGEKIFKENCVACHGQFGEGKEGLGPNFTDDYWLHGGSINNVFSSIKYGWTEKGMKSWQQDLKPSEIQLVASYVKSLRGTNPPNAKAKQGELYIEEGEKPAGDSTKAGADTLVKPGAVDTLKK